LKQNSNKFFFDIEYERNKNLTRARTQQDANKNTNNKTKHEPETNYKEKKKLNRIEPITRAKALIPDDVFLTRSGSFDTGYRVLHDPTCSKER